MTRPALDLQAPPDAFEALRFDNTFARLPAEFFSPVAPLPADAPHYLVSASADAAALLDLDLDSVPRDELIGLLSGKTLPPGCEPLAMLYAGHQFGVYVPQLGDGRALLLGEVRNSRDEKWDLVLKGAGHTPYSRSGDGRAVLRSTIREYLCSEAMHALGIPTTRALGIVGNDAPVYRETVERGAVLMRLSPSHVRFGSFEVFYYRDQPQQVRTLADYVIRHHFPDLESAPAPYEAMLREIVTRTARLIAQWQAIGFAHGVMNTDNMSVLGLTLDYGPFGFLDAFDPQHICNHSDYQGRYAFDQQPTIGLWNLACLAQALTPLIEVDAARACLDEYEPAFTRHYRALMAQKLGLREAREDNWPLVGKLLELLQANRVDYSRFMRALAQFSSADGAANAALRDMFMDREGFDRWAGQYGRWLRNEHSDDAERAARMNRVNPKYILRNYLAQIAIERAEKDRDFSEVDTLLALLRTPYDEQPHMEAYAAAPPDWAGGIEVSCSS